MLLFLQTACISPTIREMGHLLVGVLTTQASFFCELPVYTFWPFLSWVIISTTNIFVPFVVFLLIWLMVFSFHYGKFLTFILSNLGEGNGNPLQYSCLENPMDRGAWWAMVHGVAESRTQLK